MTWPGRSKSYTPPLFTVHKWVVFQRWPLIYWNLSLIRPVGCDISDWACFLMMHQSSCMITLKFCTGTTFENLPEDLQPPELLIKNNAGCFAASLQGTSVERQHWQTNYNLHPTSYNNLAQNGNWWRCQRLLRYVEVPRQQRIPEHSTTIGIPTGGYQLLAVCGQISR